MHVIGQHSCTIQAFLLGPLHGGPVALLHARVCMPCPQDFEQLDHGPHAPTGAGVVVVHGRALHGACDGPAHHLPSPSWSMHVRVLVPTCGCPGLVHAHLLNGPHVSLLDVDLANPTRSLLVLSNSTYACAGLGVRGWG